MKLPLIVSPSLNEDWDEYRVFLQEECIKGHRNVPYADLTDILTWFENRCNHDYELLSALRKIADV